MFLLEYFWKFIRFQLAAKFAKLPNTEISLSRICEIPLILIIQNKKQKREEEFFL